MTLAVCLAAVLATRVLLRRAIRVAVGQLDHLDVRTIERQLAVHDIVNEVKGVSRVVYDITGKPPATIEWE